MKKPPPLPPPQMPPLPPQPPPLPPGGGLPQNPEDRPEPQKQKRPVAKPLSPVDLAKKLLSRLLFLFRRTSVIAALSVALALLLVGAILDYLLRFDFSGRWLLLLIVVGCAFAVGRTVLRRFPRLSNVGDAALRVEREQPALKGLFISGVDVALGRFTGSKVFADGVMAASMRVQLENGKVAEKEFERRSWIALVCVGLVFLGAAAVMPDVVPRHSARVLMPFARIAPATATRLEVSPGDVQIVAGDTLQIRVHTTGTPGEYAELETERKGDVTRHRMELSGSSEGERIFEANLKQLDHDLRYRVAAGDAESFWYDVKILTPPALERIEFLVSVPEYSSAPPKRYVNPDVVEVYDSGLIQISATADRELDAAVLEWRADDTARDFDFGIDGAAASTELSSHELAGESGVLTPRLTGKNGVMSRAIAQTRIIKIEDRPPELRLDWPGREIKAVPTSEIRFEVRMFDDLALSRLAVHVMLAGETETLWKNLPLSGRRSDSVSFILPLEEFSLEVGDVVSVRLVAHDEHPLRPGENKAVLIEIEPYEQFYRYREAGDFNPRLEQLRINLDEFIRRQKGVITATSDRMGGGQEELDEAAELQASLKRAVDAEIDAVREHLKKESTGGAEIMTSLENASDAMGEAVQKLGAGDGEGGYRDELRALVELTKAFRALLTIIMPADPQQDASGSGQLQDDQIPNEELPKDRRRGGSEDTAEDRGDMSASEETKRLLDEARRALENARAEEAQDAQDGRESGDGDRSGEEPAGEGERAEQPADVAGEDGSAERPAEALGADGNTEQLAEAAQELAERLRQNGDDRAGQLEELADRLRADRPGRNRPARNLNQASGRLVDELAELVDLLERIHSDQLTEQVAEELLDKMNRGEDDIPPDDKDLVRKYFEELHKR